MVSYLTIIKLKSFKSEGDESFGMVSYLTIIKLSQQKLILYFSFGMVSYLTIIKPYVGGFTSYNVLVWCHI